MGVGANRTCSLLAWDIIIFDYRKYLSKVFSYGSLGFFFFKFCCVNFSLWEEVYFLV